MKRDRIKTLLLAEAIVCALLAFALRLIEGDAFSIVGFPGGAIGQGSIRTAALCANALAAFLGSLLAAKGFSQRRLPMTLASTGVYLLLLLLGNLLFVGAAPTDGLAVCLPSIGTAILAALLVSRKPKTRRRR